MQRYLVTGGAGFIGGHLVERLLGEGRPVVILDDLSTGRPQNLPDGVDLVVRNLVTDPLEDVVRDVAVVFHLAAVPSVSRSVREPLRSHHAAATATLRILQAARDAGVGAFITSSSSSIYGDVARPPMREDMAVAPRSPYAVAKLAAEGYTRVFASLYGMRTASLRYFNVFGPRQDPSSAYSAAIPRFIAAYLRGMRPVVYGDGRQSRDFTYVDNVVDANLLAVQGADRSGRSLNIAAGEPRSVLAVLDDLADIFGRRLEPTFEPPRPGDIRDSHADITQAREAIGYTPRVPFREGLLRTVEWSRGPEGRPA